MTVASETTSVLVAIINFGIGNFGSVSNMVRRVGGTPSEVTWPSELKDAQAIILPGVGSFDAGVGTMREHGLERPLSDRILMAGVPVLGICLGMQIMAERSEEGALPGLGWLPGSVIRFRTNQDGETIRVPHIGWNAVTKQQPSPLLEGIEDGSEFYFVHSYHLDNADTSALVGVTSYGLDFPSVIQKGRIFGTQFHPEKSQIWGEKLFRNFLAVAQHA